MFGIFLSRNSPGFQWFWFSFKENLLFFLKLLYKLMLLMHPKMGKNLFNYNHQHEEEYVIHFN